MSRGIFATLTYGHQSGEWNPALFAAYARLNDQRNFRSVIEAWSKAVGAAVKRLPRQTARMADEGSVRGDAQTGLSFGSVGRQAYENVMRQQGAIVDLLRKGDEERARHYAVQLVHQQVASDPRDAEYAAKSLCSLAQQAKKSGLYSLQLEWTERAVDLAPYDGWAHGQAADAYLIYGRLEDAAREFELARQHQETFYAEMGIGRIRRAQGRFEEALEVFRKVKAQYVSYPSEVIAWSNEGAVLREMWEFTQALNVYETAELRFPFDSSVRCGRASVLADLGQYSRSLKVYDGCIADLGVDEYALNGRAHIYSELGEASAAIADYERAKSLYPQNSVAFCGLADVYHKLGDYERALSSYHEARDAFPFIPVPYSGYAEVCKDLRRFEEAGDAFELGIGRFPFDTRCRNGKANLRKLIGRPDEALRTYDAVLSQFPYDIVAATGRALILKSMGHLDEAIQAYNKLIEARPGYLAAIHGKAAALVLQHRYEDALALLPKDVPRTADEWIAYHIRGMILLHKEQFDEALSHLEFGLLSVPFRAQRRYFTQALATVRLRQQQFGAALRVLEAETPDSVSNVLQFHAFAALSRKEEAFRVGQQSSITPFARVANIKDEIARRYGLSDEPPRFSESWLFDQECAALLEAVWERFRHDFSKGLDGRGKP